MSIFLWDLPMKGVNNFGSCELVKCLDENVCLSCRKEDKVDTGWAAKGISIVVFYPWYNVEHNTFCHMAQNVNCLHPQKAVCHYNFTSATIVIQLQPPICICLHVFVSILKLCYLWFYLLFAILFNFLSLIYITSFN